MENFNEILGKMTDFLKSESKTETIIGEQFQLGAYTCVPVMAIGMGFGGGGGGGKMVAKGNGKEPNEGEGAGAAAGFGMGPVGFLVAKGEEIQFIPARSSKGLAATFEKIPDLIDKYLDKKNKKETA